MGMTIDESTEVLSDYIDTYKICGGNGYNPATNITQEACEAFEIAISTMRKYQKIEQIIDDCNLEAWEIEKKIREVIENGNVN